MIELCCQVLQALQGRTLVTAESCTGGGIGTALTAISGSSAVYKGGVICYTNWVKQNVLNVSGELLATYGAVSAPVAEAMAINVRQLLSADVAISVTGLAGPSGDEFQNPIGCVYIAYCDQDRTDVRRFQFRGDREQIRNQAVQMALSIVLDYSRGKM